jgi:redox-sensing transcriptional repressor
MSRSFRRRIPEATIARLPLYLRSLTELAEAHVPTISSDRLAEMAGVNAAKVRKDLSYLGTYGTRGVGYDVQFLLYQMSRALGLTHDWPVVICGAGNLGTALANYSGFSKRGFPVVGIFDVDPDKIGTTIGGIEVMDSEKLATVVAQHRRVIGVITTPPEVAQTVADQLVEAGVKAVLNFAPAVISVPPHVALRKVDLALELQILGFYLQQLGEDGGGG